MRSPQENFVVFNAAIVGVAAQLKIFTHAIKLEHPMLGAVGGLKLATAHFVALRVPGDHGLHADWVFEGLGV